MARMNNGGFYKQTVTPGLDGLNITEEMPYKKRLDLIEMISGITKAESAYLYYLVDSSNKKGRNTVYYSYLDYVEKQADIYDHGPKNIIPRCN